MDKLQWIPPISWTSFEFHQFRGHAEKTSIIFWKYLLALQQKSTFSVEFKKNFQEQQQKQQQQQMSRS